MALTERLALLISLDSKGAVRGLENVGKAAERNLGKTESRVQRVGQTMQKAGAGMLAGAGLAAAGLYKAGQAAADLEQAAGGTEAVFGDAAGAVETFARKSAQSMGLSEREFREATTSIGGQLKRMTGDVDFAADQSVELTRVAADLAATYGGTTAEAVSALGAAFRGEADPAERFNLNLKIGAANAKAVELGLAASTSEVTENARAQATLALIMEQSSDAQGQFAREADTAAGSMQIASAEIENAMASLGESVAPMMADVAGALAGAAGWFSDLNEATDGAAGRLATFGTLALGAVGSVSLVAGKVIELSQSLRDADGNLTRTGRNLARLGKVTAGLGIAALAIEFHRWANSMSALNTQARDLEGVGLDELSESLEDIVQSALGRTAGHGPAAFERIMETIERMAAESPAVVEQMVELAETADGRLARALDQAGIEADDLRAALDAGVGSQVRAQEAQERSTDIVEEAAGSTADLADAEADLGAEHEKLAAKADAATKAQDKLLDSVKDLFDEITSGLEAEIEWQEAIDEVSAALTENGRTLDINTEAGRKNARALLGTRDALVGIIEQRYEETGSMREATRAGEGYVAQLREQLREAGYTEDQIADLVRQYGLVPSHVATRVTADTSQATTAIGHLIGMLDTAARKAGTPLVMNASINARDRALTERASGGPVPGPTGAPMPILAHGGEFVLSADVVDAIKRGGPTAGLGSFGASSSSGSTFNVTVNNPIGIPSEDSLRNELRRVELMSM